MFEGRRAKKRKRREKKCQEREEKRRAKVLAQRHHGGWGLDSEIQRLDQLGGVVFQAALAVFAIGAGLLAVMPSGFLRHVVLAVSFVSAVAGLFAGVALRHSPYVKSREYAYLNKRSQITVTLVLLIVALYVGGALAAVKGLGVF